MKRIIYIFSIVVLVAAVCCGCERGEKEKKATDTQNAVSTNNQELQTNTVTLYRCSIGELDSTVFEGLFKGTPDVSTEEYSAGLRTRMESAATGERSLVYGSGGYYYDDTYPDMEDFYLSIANEFYYFNESGDKKWSDFFNTETEYGFLSKNELNTAVKELMDKLGIADYKIEIFTTSKEKFEEYSQWYDEILGEDAKEMTESHYGQYEEFYYVRVYPSVDGNAMADAQLGDVDKGTYIAGPHISITYTKNGLSQLRIVNFYDTKSAEVENEELNVLTEQEAKEKLDRKFNNMLVDNADELTVSELVLLPYPYYQNGEILYYVLTPAWKFSDGKQYEVFFNAVTGDEIL